jgi:hypothetical protein
MGVAAAVSALLTPDDYRSLAARWIDSYWADMAGIRRVDNFTGAELVGGNPSKRDHSGLWIPYIFPEGLREARGAVGREYGGRLRRDHPEIERGRDGTYKPKNKYLQAQGQRNRIYIPPLVTGAHFEDVSLPLLITEGEFKAIAARRLASYQYGSQNGASSGLRFLPIGLGGVWSFEGNIGVVEDARGERVDEHGMIPDLQFFNWTKRYVIIAYDAGDVKNNPSVKAARHRLAERLMELGASVGFLEWEVDRNERVAKGLDDWLARDGHEVVLEAISKLGYRDKLHWRSKLLTTDNGRTKALLENGRIALSESDDWRGTLVLDTFLGRLTCSRRPWNQQGGPWLDQDSIYAACWLQQRGIEVGKTIAGDAAVAAAQVVDCAADWLKSLKWDGVPRIDSWLIDYMSVETKKDSRDITNYVAAVGRKWLIGGAGRILEPGSQMDYTLVFCGAEGQGKSSALRIPGRDWYTDSIKDLTNKDALITLQGKLIVEFSELEAWRKLGDLRGLLAFLTERDDNFRNSYGHHSESHPRRCIFAGTTNEEWFLDGAAEGRRFWPVRCIAPVKLEELACDCEQLWAEAKTYWLDGEKPYLTDQLLIQAASLERESYKQQDPWLDVIADHCARKPIDTTFTVADILQYALNQEKAKMNAADQRRVIACLRKLGYEPNQYGPNSKRLRGWRLAEKK